MFACEYASPLGPLLLTADGGALTGLWFAGSKYCPPMPGCMADAPVLAQTRRWLDAYFSGQEPGALPPLRPAGTPFQQEVWALLLEIPRGATETYGALARRLAKKRGISRMSAQAVGQAVGRNPISILIPCHRVLGSGGSLTGYAGGLGRKEALLRLEHRAE